MPALWQPTAPTDMSLSATRSMARGGQLRRSGGGGHSYYPGGYTLPAQPSSIKQGDNDEPLEIVWDGPKARLRRKLPMNHDVGPEPDFYLGANRAASTARRLAKTGLSVGAGGAAAEWQQQQQQQQQERQERPHHYSALDPPSAPLSARSAPTRPASRGRLLQQQHHQQQQKQRVPQLQPPERYVGGGSARTEPWLADHDFFEELGNKQREAKAYILRLGPEQARRATADLSQTWRQPMHTVDQARMHLQTPKVALEAVMLEKLPRVIEARTPRLDADQLLRERRAAMW